MNEMNSKHAIYQGGSMKKTLCTVALATVLVFALAGSAFAVQNSSGQQRLGQATIAPADVGNLRLLPLPAQTNPVVGAGTFTYQNWQPTLLGNADPAAGTTPHGNYTTTTVKCVVCHAVHYAAPGGAPVGQGQAADTLLRMRAQDSCMYCHATAGVAVNGRPVYNGLGPAVIGDGGGTIGHVTNPVGGTACSMCHTGVHGIGQDNSVRWLAGYLLTTMSNSAGYAEAPVAQPSNEPAGTNVTSNILPVTTTDMLSSIIAIDNGAVNQGFGAGEALNGQISEYAGTLDPLYPLRTPDVLREQAVGVFCAQCHDGAYATAAAGAATNVSSSGSFLYSGHRIAAEATTDWNGTIKVSSSVLNGATVAWAAAINCKSCHDATDNDNNPAFPHAWGKYVAGNDATTNGAKMWLTSAATAGTPTDPLVPMDNTAGTQQQLQDGVCLKCHVDPTGGAGVGITY
jgi:hypothetical protein